MGGRCKSVVLGRNKSLKIFVVVVAVAFVAEVGGAPCLTGLSVAVEERGGMSRVSQPDDSGIYLESEGGGRKRAQLHTIHSKCHKTARVGGPEALVQPGDDYMRDRQP